MVRVLVCIATDLRCDSAPHRSREHFSESFSPSFNRYDSFLIPIFTSTTQA